MPQVLGLVPSVTPSEQGTPEFSPNVPVDAFGGAVGHALSTLGVAIEGAGDKLWQRAMEIQQQRNEIEVDRADTEFMGGVAKLHADFTNQKGENAAGALEAYKDGIQKLREDTASKMSNQDSRMMFTRQSGGTMRSMIIAGATHASRELQAARLDAIDARSRTLFGVAASSGDPAVAEEMRNKAIALNHQKHAILGTPQSAADEDFAINSSIKSNQIQYTAEKEPDKALKMLEDGKGTFTDRDYNRVYDYARRRQLTLGSAEIANGVLDANRDEDGNIKGSFADLEKQVKAKAKDDPELEQHANRELHTLWNNKRFADRQVRIDNRDIISIAFQNGQDTRAKMEADPKTAAAIKALPAHEQNMLDNKIRNMVISRDRAFNERQMVEFSGMRSSDKSGFLDVDPSDPKYKLNTTQMLQVQAWQRQDAKQPFDDSHVKRALGWLQLNRNNDLRDLKVFPPPGRGDSESRKQTYNHFVGTLAESIHFWRENHGGKQPGPDDITNEIYPLVIQQNKQPTWFGWSEEKVPLFKSDVEKEFREGYLRDKPHATNDQIYRDFIQARLKQLEKKRQAEEQNAPGR